MEEQSAQKTPAPAPAAAPRAENSPERDLSQEIERVVEREPLDMVKCVRVFGNYYRCNWWSRAAAAHPEYSWTGVIFDLVRKSSFLNATMEAGELNIKIIGSSTVGRKNQSGFRIIK